MGFDAGLVERAFSGISLSMKMSCVRLTKDFCMFRLRLDHVYD